MGSVVQSVFAILLNVAQEVANLQTRVRVLEALLDSTRLERLSSWVFIR